MWSFRRKPPTKSLVLQRTKSVHYAGTSRKFVSIFPLHHNLHGPWVNSEFLILKSCRYILGMLSTCQQITHPSLCTDTHSRSNCPRLMEEPEVASVEAMEKLDDCPEECKQEHRNC